MRCIRDGRRGTAYLRGGEARFYPIKSLRRRGKCYPNDTAPVIPIFSKT